jgi:hypothetical protein
MTTTGGRRLPEAPASCARSLPYARAWNISARTAHIAAISVLVGGHAFDVPRGQLLPVLWLAIITGAALVFLEAFSLTYRWLFQGRGLMVVAKLVLLVVIPLAWSVRLPILLAVIVLASVGSHMPARFRYYSVLERRVL